MRMGLGSGCCRIAAARSLCGAEGSFASLTANVPEAGMMLNDTYL